MNQTHIPVKYIGKRERYTEGTYGTRIEFAQGETRLVPVDKAKLMLRHSDVYALGEATAETTVAEPQVTEVKEDEQTEDFRQQITLMDKATLAVFAKTHFNVDLDRRKGVGALRTEVTTMFDQFGVA